MLYCYMSVVKLGEMFSPVWKAKWATGSFFLLLLKPLISALGTLNKYIKKDTKSFGC